MALGVRTVCALSSPHPYGAFADCATKRNWWLSTMDPYKKLTTLITMIKTMMIVMMMAILILIGIPSGFYIHSKT